MTCLALDQIVKILLVGAVLGALPGAALANIGTAWLRKRLGVTTREVASADDVGDDSGDGDDGDT